MEDGLNVQNTYISVGCNRNPYSLDWGLNGLVAFAACNSVALYTPEVCSLCPLQRGIGMLDDRILDSNNIIVIWMADVSNLKQILSV